MTKNTGHSPVINLDKSQYQSGPSHYPATSPVKGELSFFKALQAVMDGKKITRKDWNDEETYGFLGKDEYLMIQRSDTGPHTWIISLRDMQGLDWIVLD